MIAGLTGLAIFQVWMSKRAYDSAKLKKDITNYLHEKTLAVAHYMKAVRAMGTIIKKNMILSSSEELRPLVDLVDKAEGKLKELLELLDSSTFAGQQPTIISLSGRVLAAHKLIEEVKDEIIPIMAAVGKLDVYVSTARLYKEFEGQRVGYCFPTYIENAQTPYINATNFWNPFVSPNIAVANTIEFGSDQHPNNAILTGPNTGGKTTTIKGIEIALLLAQTLGMRQLRNLR